MTEVITKIDTRYERETAELVHIAGDMAWGAAKAWHLARDVQPDFSCDDLHAEAADIVDDWNGEAMGDPADAIARELIKRRSLQGAEIYLDN